MSTCFHCGNPLPKQCYPITFNNETQLTCCPACQSVCQQIIDSGLGSYYVQREEKAPNPEWLTSLTQSSDSAPSSARPLTNSPEPISQQTYYLPDMHCSSCVWLIEKKLAEDPNISACQANYFTKRLTVKWKTLTTDAQLNQRLASIGYRAVVYTETEQNHIFQQENATFLRQLILSGLGTMQVMMLAFALYAADFSQDMQNSTQLFLRIVSAIIATAVLFYAGNRFLASAYSSLKHKQINMDVPIAVALVLSYVSSWVLLINNAEDVYFDAVCMFVFLLSLGRYAEFRVRAKAHIYSENLNTNTPIYARRIIPSHVASSSNTEQATESVRVETLNLGDELLVQSGETIPSDGIISAINYQNNARQTSHNLETILIDESLLTGESLPVKKQQGDTVLAGSINIDALIQITVNTLPKNNYLQQIKTLLNTSNTDNPILDKNLNWTRYFSFFTLIIATLAGLLWLSIDPEKALWITVSVLVVSCPCALSLAIPSVYTVGNQQLAKLGLLVKTPAFLTQLSQTTDFIFDKTGTLTEGQFSLLETIVFNDADFNDVSGIAYLMEKDASHPLAKAFKSPSQLLQERSMTHWKQHPSQGIAATINNTPYRLGNFAFINAFCSDAVLKQTTGDPNPEKICLYLATQTSILGLFIFKDQVKPLARALIQTLNQHATTHLLSGDSSKEVERIQHQLGIHHAKKQQMPQDKVNYIKLLHAQNNATQTCMLGDGINDAPVLHQATASIAMGTGSDLALISADAILTNPKLSTLLDAINLSKRASAIIKQNQYWAIAYNLFMIPLACMGLIPPYIAAIGMSISSLVVVLNALRLSKTKKHAILNPSTTP